LQYDLDELDRIVNWKCRYVLCVCIYQLEFLPCDIGPTLCQSGHNSHCRYQNGI